MSLLSSRGTRPLLVAAILFAAVLCCVAFPSRARGQAQAGPQAPTTVSAQSQPRAQSQTPPTSPPPTAAQPRPPAQPDLDTLLARFNKKLHDAKVKKIVVISPQLRANGQKAIQDWVVAQVKEALSHDPKGFTVFQDKPGDGSDLGEGNLGAAGIDTVVSVSAYPNQDGVLITLHAASGHPFWGFKSTALFSVNIPTTDEMAALLPAGWKQQIEEEKAAPQVPNASYTLVSKLPSCTYCPDPQYTILAKQFKIEGDSFISASVELDGTAHEIQLVKGQGFGLDELAMEAVSHWKFKPARDKVGNPIATKITIEVDFKFR